MRNIRLVIAYDGTDYRGWQRLGRGAPTVQGKLEAVLSRVLGEGIELTGAGRTDAGVHAEGQVANFHTDSRLGVDKILRLANGYLPVDIAVLAAEDVDPRFHARYNATAKTYRYRIRNTPGKDPFLARYALQLAETLDADAMNAAGKAFLGALNFQSFTTLKEKEKSFVRTVRAIAVEKNGGFIDITFVADGFLWNQARIMAWTLIEAGLGRIDADGIRSLIEARRRAAVSGMAEARGLCLVSVEYGQSTRQAV